MSDFRIEDGRVIFCPQGDIVASVADGLRARVRDLMGPPPLPPGRDPADMGWPPGPGPHPDADRPHRGPRDPNMRGRLQALKSPAIMIGPL